jgi:hypothetical protein
LRSVELALDDPLPCSFSKVPCMFGRCLSARI